MIILLILAIFLVNLLSQFGNKKLQTIFPSGNIAYAFYALITGIISTLNFLVMTGFKPKINMTILLLSLFYSILCRLSYVITFKSLEYNGVFLNTALSRVGQIIPPIIISALFLGEKQGLGTILGGIAVIIAAALPGISSGNKTKKSGVGKILCTVGILVNGTLSTMLAQLLVQLEGAESILSYSLFTNVFIIITSVFSFISEAKHGEITKEIRAFKKEHYFLTFLVATMSNLSAYVSRYILEFIDVIQNTVISSSVVAVVTIMVSQYYKEKLTKRHIVSAILSILAACLPLVM